MKKNLLRLVFGVLCLCMVLSVCSFTAFADDTYPITSIVSYRARVKFTEDDETREYPYEASNLKKSYSKGSEVDVVNKVTNKYDNVWYQTTAGTYVWSGVVEVQWYQVSTFSNEYYSFNKNDETRAKPFESSTLKESHDLYDIVQVTRSVKNKYDNVWYQTSAGYYVYSGDVDYCYKFQANLSGKSYYTCDDDIYAYKLPYDSASKVKTLSEGTYVNPVCSVKNKTLIGTQNLWYKLSDGTFVYDGDLTFQYKNPAAVDSMLYEAKKATSSYVYPYASGTASSIAKGKMVTVVLRAVNRDGNYWLELSNGRWVSESDFTYRGKITTSGFVSGTSSGVPSGNLTYGCSFDLKGTVTASDKIVFVEAGVTDTLTSKPALSTVSLELNTTSFNVNTSLVNTQLDFSQLPVGQYKYYMTVTLETGYVKKVADSQFNVISVAPSITTQPSNKTVKIGSTATFKVAASGSGLTYRWQYSSDGSTWKNSSATGYNTATLKVTGAAGRNGFRYRCKVTNNAGSSVVSNAAKLTVYGITHQPSDKTVKLGFTTTFAVAAVGSNIQYQWQYSSNGGSTWKDCTDAMPGGTTDTLQIKGTTTRNGFKFRCVVTFGSNTVTSNTVTLTVYGITSQPSSKTVLSGNTAVFSVSALGSGLTYQWQLKADGAWKDCTAATNGFDTDTIRVVGAAVRNGRQYRCIVIDENGNRAVSSAANLTVVGFTTQPTNKTVYADDIAVFKAVAIGSDVTYQWQLCKDGSSWTNCSSLTTGYNTNTLQVVGKAARNGWQYRCKITVNGVSAVSNTVTLTVK